MNHFIERIGQLRSARAEWSSAERLSKRNSETARTGKKLAHNGRPFLLRSAKSLFSLRSPPGLLPRNQTEEMRKLKALFVYFLRVENFYRAHRHWWRAGGPGRGLVWCGSACAQHRIKSESDAN